MLKFLRGTSKIVGFEWFWPQQPSRCPPYFLNNSICAVFWLLYVSDDNNLEVYPHLNHVIDPIMTISLHALVILFSQDDLHSVNKSLTLLVICCFTWLSPLTTGISDPRQVAHFNGLQCFSSLFGFGGCFTQFGCVEITKIPTIDVILMPANQKVLIVYS